MTPDGNANSPDPDLSIPDEQLRNMLMMGLSNSEMGKATSSGSRPSGSWDPPPVERLQEALPQYESYELIGRGGMGAVYRSYQRSLDRYVAVKVLPGDILDEMDANYVQRFQNEARTMAKMDHPGIVKVIDFGETEDRLLYYVMEYVEGTDVAQLVKASGKLPPVYALSIATQVCDALSYAHEKGVVHRDIKPANVLIGPDGKVKVADFGLAKAMNQDLALGLTVTNMRIGTPDYAAPESLAMGKSTDHRADLYAMGVMIYNMLTGEIPRGRFKLPSEKVRTDPRFDAIINHAMETEREERYQSAAEIRRDLDRMRSSLWAKEGEVLGPELVIEQMVVKAYFPLISDLALELGPMAEGEGPRRFTWRHMSAAMLVILLLGGGAALLGIATKSAAKRDAEGGTEELKSQTPATFVQSNRDDRPAVMMVLKKGGRAVVRYGDGQMWETRSTSLLPAGKLTAIQLRIAGPTDAPTRLTKGDMSSLAGLSDLISLDLYSTNVTDEMLDVLQDMSGLQTLLLRKCKNLSDAAMEHIAPLKNLRVLSFESSPGITSKGVLGLKELTHLEELGLSNLPEVDESVLPIVLGMRKLWWIEVHNSPKLGRTFVEKLSELPALTELYLNIQHLDPVINLGKFKGLRQLRLYGVENAKWMTSAAVESMGLSSTMEHLQLSRVNLGETEMELMASRLPWLKSLWIESVQLPPSGLASMQDAPLERLEVGTADRMFDNSDLLSLGGISALQEVKLPPNSAVNSTGIEEFAKIREDVLVSR